MSTLREWWSKLRNGKSYRKDLVATLLKRGTAMQIQSLMKQKGWTQAELAKQAGLTQGVISRASNPDYGNLTFNTVIDIAAGFDVAFVGRFVPFTEFAKWAKNMPDEMVFSIPSFDQENENAESLPHENARDHRSPAEHVGGNTDKISEARGQLKEPRRTVEAWAERQPGWPPKKRYVATHCAPSL